MTEHGDGGDWKGEEGHILYIVQYVYVLWVGGHILVSDWQNSRQSYLSTQTSQSKISVREELQNNIKQSANKSMTISWYIRFQMKVNSKTAKNAHFSVFYYKFAVSIVNW